MTADEIRSFTLEDGHRGALLTYAIHVWPSTRAEVIKEEEPYWSNRGELAGIDGIAMKARRVITTASQ